MRLRYRCMSSFQSDVYRIVSQCPRGKVVSYGGVAAMAGKPRAARAVGTLMRELPDGSKVPWWRVINSRGEVSMRDIGHGPAIQRTLLEKEGVKFDKAGRVSWEKFGWTGE
jgi:methylated-DNA-protein-cysteine methyltransferase related protein